MTVDEICNALKDELTNKQKTNASSERFQSACKISPKSAILVRLGDKLSALEESADGGQDAFNGALFELAGLCVSYLSVATNSVN